MNHPSDGQTTTETSTPLIDALIEGKTLVRRDAGGKIIGRAKVIPPSERDPQEAKGNHKHGLVGDEPTNIRGVAANLAKYARMGASESDITARATRLLDYLDANRPDKVMHGVSCPDGTDADEPADRGFVCCHEAERDRARNEVARLVNRIEERNTTHACEGTWETCWCDTCQARRDHAAEFGADDDTFDPVGAVKWPSPRVDYPPIVGDTLRKLAKCTACNGRGEYLPSCSMCHDSTWDHECPSWEPCSVCKGSKINPEAAEAIAALEGRDTDSAKGGDQ